jgi:hypothetical protein
MKPRSRAQAHLKKRLQDAGVTYADVARLSRVTWRMVKMVIDGDRTSANVMGAIDRLAPESIAQNGKAR